MAALELDSSITSIGGFKTVKVKDSPSKNDEITYRVAISNEKEAKEWLRNFTIITKTEWIVYQTYPNAER